MTKHDTSDADERPTIQTELGLPGSVTLPDDSVGLFTFSREELNLPIGERHYRLQGVLTSEGWIPPAPRSIAHLLGQVGNTPHDLNALGEYSAGKGTRLAIGLREFDKSLTNEGSVELNEKAWSLLGSPFQEAAEYYLPGELSQEETAEYLQNTVTAAREYAHSQITENPTDMELADILTEQYGIEHETALTAVKMNADRREE